MADILKTIKEKLPGKVSDAIFEGANIVLYTKDKEFFKDSETKIKEIVDSIKKRIELRADKEILASEEETEKTIKAHVPPEAEITNVIFDVQRSTVIIEAKKPGLVIGKQGSILNDIKKSTLWISTVQRSPAIQSKITEKIRSVLYANNTYRRKFLNDIGQKIYKDWSSEKMEMWVRLTYLGGGRQVGRSCLLLHTPNSKVLLDCGINPAITEGAERFPYLDVTEIGDLASLDAIILSHAHLDHCGLIPYLYKMGYKGPIYLTAPTRDIASLLQLDLIGVAYKKAEAPIYRAEDIKDTVKHSVTLNYGEVTDITPDIRITMYNAGHVLGSAQVHINIGNGLHNFVYSGDTKYGKTRLLDPANNRFPRIETLQMESTYGSKEDILPPRKEVENKFIELVKETIDKKGKVLLPELGLGHSQETMLRVEEAIRTGEIPQIPVYIDGMIWDINAIHTAYPDFLSASVRNQIFQDNNPFVSEIFQRIGSPAERKAVIEGGPCIIIATSGMLVGGASVEYFKNLAENENNLLVLSSYQGPGSLGRQVQEGAKEVTMSKDFGGERITVNMKTVLLSGLSPHSNRNELMQYVSRMNPKPKRIVINHGEPSKSLDLASSIYKSNRIETSVPKNLETIRLK
ncbi:beta-CASP ribonuclease aCPSF1 [Candidatus Pacearchaeota archaeon]|nr:beta-CASP ribonuclease aCPSF1 [Candidatus Pacearchaeota archaeon]|tara:strand:- start:2076 stop:3968 length:1893 start_codon:yes stop_codon:yes gene_type:complete